MLSHLSCPTLSDVACQSPLSVGFSRQEYWVGCHALLQRIFLTPGLNPGHQYCRWILYCLSHQGSPTHIKCFCLTYFFPWRKQEEGRQERMNLSDQDHVTPGQLLFSCSYLTFFVVVVKLQTTWGNLVSLFIANYKICTWLKTFMIDDFYEWFFDKGKAKWIGSWSQIS